jgi:hypothetical protein
MSHPSGFTYPVTYYINPEMPVTKEICHQVFSWTLEFPEEVKSKLSVWRVEGKWYLDVRLLVDGPVLLKNIFDSFSHAVLLASVVQMLEAQSYLRRDYNGKEE